MTAPLLSYADLAATACLVVLNAALSLWLNLGVARALLVAAAVGVIVQLLLVRLVLRTVFALGAPWLMGAVVLAMFLAASYEIVSRQERRFGDAWGFGIGASTAMVATLFVTAFALVALRPGPWFAPPVVIPLVGIVLGSVMKSVSISPNALNTGVMRERAAIGARLALRWIGAAPSSYRRRTHLSWV